MQKATKLILQQSVQNICSNMKMFVPFDQSRKFSIRGYILGVLAHTTALDQLWGGDETLK